MKKFLPTISLLFAFCAISFFFLNEKETTIGPLPTDGDTIINEKGEADGNEREAWFAQIHSAAPGIDWKSIESQTRMARHETRAKERKNDIQNRSGACASDWVVPNYVFGNWEERGSANQSGSIGVVEYDPVNDVLYAISAGGTLWKGSLDGSNWNPLNEDLKFSWNILRRFVHNGGHRMIAVIDKIVHYSDDEGATWNSSTGLVTYSDNWGSRGTTIMLDNTEKTIYMLVQEWDSGNWQSEVNLYRSTDLGVSFQIEMAFGPTSLDHLDITQPENTNDFYLVQQVSNSEIKTYKRNTTNGTLNLVSTDQSANIEPIGNITATSDGSVNYLYYASTDSKLYRSTDDGQNWVLRGSLPKDPWDCGVRVGKNSVDKLYLGEVECYRTYDGGINWTKVNTWGQYYSNVANKLHADIMRIQFFQKSDGTHFLVNTNHGGINISYDDMLTTPSIALTGLNVSQYYDVSTDGTGYIYAGSQDQGFQRAQNLNGVLNFDQVISGDYGHTEFSDNGQRLWTVYPGGWVSYYNNPQTNGYNASYDLESTDEAAWIPHIMPSPDPLANTVYMAGGNANGGTGSHIIELTYQNGNILSNNKPFDFLAASGGTVASMEVSNFDTNKWYVATSNGQFYYSVDGGNNFTGTSSFSGPEEHYLYGSTVLASTVSDGTVYLGGSGYSNPSVYKSTNGGQSFTPMDNGLPPTLVFKIVSNEDESLLFAATEAGPYVYVAQEDLWYDLHGNCAPAQTYWSVEYLEYEKIARFGTYGRGIWDFHVTIPSLAVEFTAFHAYANEEEQNVVVDWSTQNEENTKSYWIERSEDNKTFEKVNEVESEGADENGYVWIDTAPLEGVSYYRLKEMRLDGTFEYSKSVSVQFRQQAEILIYPNPVKSGDHITISTGKDERIKFELYRMSGQLVLTKEISSGQNISLIDVPEGTYFYKAAFGAKVHGAQIIVH